jgi:anti-sigma regulatory factor (Ser/Thr protein kinase)/anti-anti-sigma regulatory factor
VSMRTPELRCRVAEDFPVAVLEVTGTLSVQTAPALHGALLECLTRKPKLVVADVAGMAVGDDVALTLLPALARHAAAGPGIRLVLGAPGPRLAAALERMAVGRYVGVYPTVEQAVASRTEPAPRRMVSEVLEPSPSSLAAARGVLQRACAGWGVPSMTDVAQVVATELVANAVRHARTPMRLVVTMRHRYLHIFVHDQAGGRPRIVDPDSQPDGGGRGLMVVEALAAAWGSTATADGKFVWATLRLPVNPS